MLANMVSLFIVGPPLERLLGRWRFSAIYLLSGLGGGVAIYLWGDVLGPVGGASGAIFGLFGACLILVRQLGLDLMKRRLAIHGGGRSAAVAGFNVVVIVLNPRQNPLGRYS